MLNLRFLAAILWLRKWAFLATFAIFVAGAAVLICSRPAQFKAEFLLEPDTRPLRSALNLSTENGLARPGLRIEPSFLTDAVNALSSFWLIEKLIDKAQLDHDPEFATQQFGADGALASSIDLFDYLGIHMGGPQSAVRSTRGNIVRRISKAITVEIPRGSSQIRVGFYSIDATKASKLVTMLVDLYLNDQVESKQRAAEKTLADLRYRLGELGQEIDTANITLRSQARAVRDPEVVGVSQTLNSDRQLQLQSEVRAKQAVYEELFATYSRAVAFGSSAVPDIRVVYPAGPVGQPTSPTISLLLISIPVAALMGAVAIVFYHQLVSLRRPTAREFEIWTGVPVTGICPMFHYNAKPLSPAKINGRQSFSEYRESVRAIRNFIDCSQQDIYSVAVTSALQGEGKSTFAGSLAAAWAQAGVKTLLIGCDTRRPGLSSFSQRPENGGLADLLGAPTQECKMIQSSALGFDFIASGTVLNGSFDGFTSKNVGNIIQSLSCLYEKIILDLPPVLATSEALVGAVASDIVLFVYRWGVTNSLDARSALELLHKVQVTNLQAVLYRVDRRHYEHLANINQYASYGYEKPREPHSII